MWPLLIIFFTSSVFGLSLSEKLEKNRYYFSALNNYFIETFNKKITANHLDRLERLLLFTGIEILDDYDHQLLQKYPTSSTFFILARRSLQEKDFKKANFYFDKISLTHRYYPESQLLNAQVFAKLENLEKESESNTKCQAAAKKLEDKNDNEKIKRYYRMVYEICLLNQSRRLYKQGKFSESLDSYNKIPKQSYKWPYILLEKAWVHYMLGDFNRALGLLVTYKSPLLETYFFPEAEYLASLIYFRLCLYQDSLAIINQYHKIYLPRFNQLSSFFKNNLKSQDYFFNLMFNSNNDLQKKELFIRHIITRLRKQTRFSLDFNTVFKIEREMARIKKNEKKEVQDLFMDHLGAVRTNVISKINYNAKTDIFNFLESVSFFSAELFKINLEIISKQKDLVYKNKKLISNRSRGDYSNVNKNKFEQFWKFEGAFWADELGDYSLGLKSNCQSIATETSKDAL